MVKLARTLGRVAWAIDIPSPRAEAYRDTRGPGLEGWQALLAAARKRATTPKGKRDLALVRLMHDLGLRRGEVVALDLADLDLEAGTVAVVGKGKSEKTNVTLNAADGGGAGRLGRRPGRLAGAAVRPARPRRRAGPPRPAGRGQRGPGLEGAGAAGRAGPRTNPHGLRHQGITRALDLADGDVRKVKRFSRHAKLETLLRYDDNRSDEAGAIAKMLGEDSE